MSQHYHWSMPTKSNEASRQRMMALMFVCLSLLVISLNNNTLNVALPSISKSLHASSSELQWVIDAYILVFAALLLTMGAIGDRFGRKRALEIGLATFAVGSVLAGMSTSILPLILLRGFLGIGGAIIMPATLSIISATFEDPKERSQAIALWAATFGLGIGIGPVMSGWLLMHFSWNSVFYINVPVVAAALIGTHIHIGESKDERAPPADLIGVLLSIIGLVSLLFAVIQAGVIGWKEPKILIALASAAIFLTGFAVWESRTKNPMLPLYLFKNRSFTGANIALTLIMFCMFGSSFFLSQYFQIILGYTALQTGLGLLPLAIAVVITSALSAKVSEKLGVKITVAGAILVVAIGLFYLAFVEGIGTSYETLLFGMIIVGIGLGTATGPATDSVMGAVPVSKAGVGSAMNDTTRELGGAMGVAVLGTISNRDFLGQINQLLILNLLPKEEYDLIRSGIVGAHQFASYIPFYPVQERFIAYVNEAFVYGMRDAMFVGATIMVLAAVLTYIFLPAQIERAKI
jgi:EmrB/QacA subfamily drug resistance transporter